MYFRHRKAECKGSDIEAWLPGQNKYRETHTADYMTDYQSRRLQTRVRRTSGEVELFIQTMQPHLPVDEQWWQSWKNYQNEDMTIRVPKVLQCYMGGKEVL